jgi:RNA polymerase sigma factor for flagellar operon FliA
LRAASEVLEAQSQREAAARARGAAAPDTEERLREIKEAMAAIETVYVVAAAAPLEAAASVVAPAADVDGALDAAAFRPRVTDALAKLPDKERALVEKHYFEGKNLLDAGAELGISKSWASRLHAQAIGRLRRWLVARE